MDKRERKYYLVSLAYNSYDMRLRTIQICVPSLKIHSAKPHNGIIEYQQLFSCRKNDSESIEYELRKAERRDGYCLWEEV